MSERESNEMDQLREQQEKFREWAHGVDITMERVQGQVNGLQKNMDELLDNSRWMKRAWTKMILGVVGSVGGTVILALGGLVWYLATK